MLPLPLVLDSDGGIDDAAALWFAATDARIELLAVIATWGNVDLDTATANLRRALHAAGRDDVPVVAGASTATGPGPIGRRPAAVHADDGLGGHADDWPVGDGDGAQADLAAVGEVLAARPGEIAVVTIGPMSTLAPVAADVAPQARSITVMGGSVRRGGNLTAAGEANVVLDPCAASTVLAAPWRAPPLLVGLDVTMAALLGPDELAAAAASSTTAGRFLAGPLAAYADAYSSGGWTPPGHVPCHDLLAVVATVDPDLLTEVVEVPVGVDTGGSAAWGSTVADLRPGGRSTEWPTCRVALGVDADRFRAAFRAMVA